MDERLARKALRHKFNVLGWALLVYMGILNVSVFLVCFLEASYRLASEGIGSLGTIVDSLMENGWGYILAIAIGALILRLWKGREFCCHEIWTQGRPMEFRDFLCLLCVFVSSQLVFQIVAMIQECLLNRLGLSALDAIEAATGLGDTFSMFLYMGILAPIAEEILFRGLVLRTLLPHGKRFAILLSAFLFGIFHGNLVQTPYAFCVGLVLGYVAVEYSMAWAMVLHMFNNLILADVMSRLTARMSGYAGNLIFWLVIVAFSLGAVVVVIRRRKEILAYIRKNPVEDKAVACFFTAPGVIALTVFLFLNIAAALLFQLL